MQHKFDCPEEDCPGVVLVDLEWEDPDPSYGADADGNRGMYVAGYWSGEAEDTCSAGHTFTPQEREDIATDAANDQPEPEEEYWGPDGPDDDY